MDLLTLAVNLSVRGQAATEKSLDAVERKAESTNRSLERLQNNAKQGAEFKAEAKESGFASLIKKFARVRSEAAKPADMEVRAQTSGFEEAGQQTGSLRRDLTKLNGTTARMQAQVDGVTGVLHRLGRVDERMDNLQGRVARMGVAVAGGAAAGAILGVVASKFDLVSQSVTALARVKMPLLYAAMGGLAGVIAPVSAAVVGLAGALAQGAAGFALIGGAAAGGAVAGLAAYTAAARAAVSGAMLVREETRKAANEQLKQQRVAILNTAATRKFNVQLDKTAIALTKVQAELGNRMLPAFTRMTAMFTSKLPALTPPLYRLADGVTAIGESFVRAVLKGQGLKQLQSVLGFIASSGITAAKILSNLGRGALAGIQPVLPAATRLLDKIRGLSSGFLQFTQSSKGVSAISGVVGILEKRMYQVLGVIGNLSKGLFNLGAAFAPLGSAMLADLGNLTRKFAQLTSKGSGFRREVSTLNTAGIPIIRAMAGVVGELWTQFFRVGKAAMNLRMEGSKTRVLVAIFNSLKAAVAPMADALIRSFTNLGPLLPPLITAFSRLFNTFVGQSPLIGQYIRFLTQAMNIFNRLPAPLQSAVIQVAAFNTVFGGVGSTVAGAAAGLAGYILQMRTLRAVQALSTGQQVAYNASMNAGVVATLRAKAAAVGHKVAMFASAAATKAMTVAQRALNLAMRMNPIGILITALAALAVGFVLLYRRSDRFRALVNGIGSALQGFASGALKMAGNAIRSFGALLGRVFGPAAKSAANALRFLATNGLAFVTRIGKQMLSWARGQIPLLKQIFDKNIRPIGRLVSAVFRGAVSLVKRVWGGLTGWFRGNSKLMGEAAVSGFKIIKKLVGFLLKPTVLIVKTLWRGLTAFFRQNGKELGNIVKQLWRVIRGTFATGMRIIGNIVRLGLQVLAGDWRGAGKTIKRIWQLMWNQIKRVADAAWKILKSLFRIGANVLGSLWKGLWNALKKAATAGWNAIQSGVKAAWNAIKNTTSSIWNGIRDFFTKWWNKLKDFVINTARALGQGVADRWKSMKAFAESIWKAYRLFLERLWRNLKDAVVGIARALGQAVADRWKGMKSFAESMWNLIRDGVTSRFRKLRDNVVSVAANLGQTIADRWKGMKSTAFSLWDAIKEGVKNRVRDMRSGVVNIFEGMVNKVREWLGGLAIALANVLKFIGMKDKAGDLRSRGNALQEPLQFARGGTYNADRGGIAGPGRMGIVGEAGQDEAIVNLERRTPQSVAALKRANASPNASDHSPRMQPHRRGGVFTGARKPTGTGPGGMPREGAGPIATPISQWKMDKNAGRMGEDVSQKFGVPAMTYAGHNRVTGQAADAVDWPVAGWGNYASGASLDKGNSIKDYLLGKLRDYAIRNIIWQNRIWQNGGWSSYGRSGATGGHYDHVHSSVFPGGLSGRVFRSVGGVFSGVKDALGNAYNSVADFIKQKFKPPSIPSLPGGEFGASLATGLGKTVLDNAKKWITEQAESRLSIGDSSGGAVTPYEGDWATAKGGSPSVNRGIAQAAAKEIGWNFSAWDELGRRESGWDRFARNPSSGAYGIPQCMNLDTMILTRAGWKRHDEVEIGDETIGYNPETGKSEWTAVLDVLHPGVAEVRRYGTKRWTVESTPNHRWLVEMLDSYKESRVVGEQMVQARDLRRRQRMVLTREADTASGLDITTQEAGLLGWIAGEGWKVPERVKPRKTPDRGRKNQHRPATFHISQSKPEHIDAISEAVGEGGRITRRRPYKSRKNGVEGVSVEWRLSAPYARDLCERAGGIDHPRDDAVSLVLAMSTEQREAWLAAVIKAEGHISKPKRPGSSSTTQISQRPGEFADAIVLAVYMAGYRPSMYLNEKTNVLAITLTSYGMGIGRKGVHVDEPAGEKEVWCVTTGLGTWTAQQDGNVFLTGNSLPESKLPAAGQSGGGSQAGPQIAWMADYIKGRYTNPEGAIAHHNRMNWYERGGVVPGKGPQPGILHGGERVLPEKLARGFEILARALDNWATKAKGLLPDSLLRTLTANAGGAERLRKDAPRVDSPAYNSARDPNRAKPGYVRAEDGSWVRRNYYSVRPSTMPLNAAQIGRSVNGMASTERLEREIARLRSDVVDKLGDVGLSRDAVDGMGKAAYEGGKGYVNSRDGGKAINSQVIRQENNVSISRGRR